MYDFEIVHAGKVFFSSNIFFVGKNIEVISAWKLLIEWEDCVSCSACDSLLYFPDFPGKNDSLDIMRLSIGSLPYS